MRIIVNDTSCLIDLRKAGILHAALLLPFRFQIALPLVRLELLDFTPAEVNDLEARGLDIIDLTSGQVERALIIRANEPALSLNDCLSIVLAEEEEDGILLTGDRKLREQASAMGLKVHGVLWVCDRLQESRISPYSELLNGLVFLRDDPVAFLPMDEIEARIARLQRLLGVAIEEDQRASRAQNFSAT